MKTLAQTVEKLHTRFRIFNSKVKVTRSKILEPTKKYCLYNEKDFVSRNTGTSGGSRNFRTRGGV